jgi:hypothetical protein
MEEKLIPEKLDEELAPARSYGLLENVEQGKTEVDQSDGDDDYFQACEEVFEGADWSLECYLYCPRED